MLLKAGTVWITTGLVGIEPEDESKPERFVYIQVRDSGCGMDQSVQAKIFDPFFTTKFMGRVSVWQRFRVSLGTQGTMLVQSAPGKGTTFRVSLPVPSDVFPKAQKTVF